MCGCFPELAVGTASFYMSIDPSSFLVSAFTTLGISQWLRKFLDLKAREPVWDDRLRWLWVAVALPLIVLQSALRSESDVFVDLYKLIAFGGGAYLLSKFRGYRPARTLLMAGAPLAISVLVSTLLEWLVPTFAKSFDTTINVAQLFAVIWMFVFMGVARREKRTLEQDEARRAEERAQLQISEARKAELEYLVAERTATLRAQAEELQHALDDLKTTQAQLIHSEKMASLGELTAGIAHEIQNPLNFVNNFAEVSVELLDELNQEQARPAAERDPGLEADLLGDLRQNLSKINDHGQRAASIVRGMLQHSRAGSGQREPTDLNGLADEYLRLAYHGLRAKDKTFNAQFVAHLDPALVPVAVVSQDVGRVLLNLFTNAFYAVRQRQRGGAPATYQPTVTVTSRHLPGGGAEIRVHDNGTGIPDSVREKIFQPFFTTKPTGEGTGLGLSLAYDIITKGHGGTLTVHSEAGEFTEFVITLPGQAATASPA